MIIGLLVALAIVTLLFVAFWTTEARRAASTADPGAPNGERIVVGFFSNFFDALGIGSFATSTTYFRLRKLVKDELIPGTLNVGHCLPTITQAFIGILFFTGIVGGISSKAVEPPTLVMMIIAAVAGAWFGAAVVSRMPRRAIQVGMGIALLIAAVLMFAKASAASPASIQRFIPSVITQLLPSNDSGTLDLVGVRLVIGLAGSFFLGSIMPLGIGYYAPCMILVNLLGMNPKASFPIMMGACAFLMPVASVQFVRKNRYSLRAASGLAAGGIFGAALALLWVQSMNLTTVMWLVTVVVIYTGVSLLMTASREKRNAVSV